MNHCSVHARGWTVSWNKMLDIRKEPFTEFRCLCWLAVTSPWEFPSRTMHNSGREAPLSLSCAWHLAKIPTMNLSRRGGRKESKTCKVAHSPHACSSSSFCSRYSRQQNRPRHASTWQNASLHYLTSHFWCRDTAVRVNPHMLPCLFFGFK